MTTKAKNKSKQQSSAVKRASKKSGGAKTSTSKTGTSRRGKSAGQSKKTSQGSERNFAGWSLPPLKKNEYWAVTSNDGEELFGSKLLGAVISAAIDTGTQIVRISIEEVKL